LSLFSLQRNKFLKSILENIEEEFKENSFVKESVSSNEDYESDDDISDTDEVE